MNKWTLESWKNLSIDQSPGWVQNSRLDAITNILRGNPPLVFKDEILLLKKRLAMAHRGKYFIVQGKIFGDVNYFKSKDEIRKLIYDEKAFLLLDGWFQQLRDNAYISVRI